MALRNGQGNGRGVVRLEALPFDELPAGTPGERGPVDPDKAVRSAPRFAALRA